MKKMLLSLFVAFLLLVGCQENSVNNPISPNSPNKIDPAIRTTLQGVIPLELKLAAPGPVMGEIYYRLKGDIDYSETINRSISTAADLNNEIELVLTIDASLENLGEKDFPASTSLGSRDNKVLLIYSKSEDLVQVPANSTLEKTFPVVKGQDELDLNCTFLVNTDGVKLEQAFLDNPRIDRTN